MNHFPNTYCEARFFRPTGLGNRMFAWARAKIFSSISGCKMLSPEWAHLRGASILRGGIDYNNALRKILLVDNFKPARQEVKGLEKIILRKQCVLHPVGTLEEAFRLVPPGTGKHLVSFEGQKAHEFHELWPHKDLVISSLKEITKRKWLRPATLIEKPFIGINARMGNDYKKTVDMNAFLNDRTGHLQTPLNWYVQSLRKTREMLGSNLTAVLISDGKRDDLKILLNEPGVILGSSKSAIGDLMILTGASVLLGAGRSSFSAWASFLGGMPTITIPGSNLQGYQVSADCEKHYVGEFDPANPAEPFYDAIKTLV